ncbi:MAG: ABC transporter substrate-binding protein [Desulfarculaceae bacterium]|jgi:peptide/nickel transport system substrate-binding protein
MLNRLKRCLVLTAALVLLAFPGAAGAETVLRVVMPNDLNIIDPVFTTSHLTRNHGYMVYDTLFAMDSKGKPQPQMVEKYEMSSDGLVYTFTLRSGLAWHDGKPVTAADCVASLKRWGQKDRLGKMLFKVVKSLEVKDAKNFQMVLTKKSGFVIDALGEASGNVPFMMPERLARTPVSKQIKDPIGSGPFIMKTDEWSPGNKAVYIKNPNYKPRSEPPDALAGGKVVKVDRVEWLYIPDDGTAQAALMAGEIDFLLQPRFEMIPTLSKLSDIVVDTLISSGNQNILRPNFLHPPFNHPKAREALLYLINQEQYMKLVIGNPKFYRTSYALFMSGTPYASEVGTEALKAFDPEKAKQLFKEAGYDGRPIVLLQQKTTNHFKAATVTAQNLRRIGIKVKVKPVTGAMFFQERAVKKPPEQGGWNLFHTHFNMTTIANPLTNSPLASSCNQQGWPGWPCDPKIEELKAKFAEEPDFEKRKKIAVEIQKEWSKYITHAWIGEHFIPSAWRKNLSGLIKAPIPVFWNVVKKK